MDHPEHWGRSVHSVSCSSSPFDRDVVSQVSWHCHLAGGGGEDPVENAAAAAA